MGTKTLTEQELVVLQTVQYQQSHSNSQYFSQITALVYLSNRDTLTETLQFEKVGFTLNSSELESLIRELETQNLASIDSSVTFGGGTRDKVYITGQGGDVLSDFSDTELIDSVIEICDEYGEIPISNLVSIIRESENSIEWLR